MSEPIREGMPFFPGAALGDTLVSDADEIMHLGVGAGSATQWVPVSTGDPDNPGLVFYQGHVLLYPIPSPALI